MLTIGRERIRQGYLEEAVDQIRMLFLGMIAQEFKCIFTQFGLFHSGAAHDLERVKPLHVLSDSSGNQVLEYICHLSTFLRFMLTIGIRNMWILKTPLEERNAVEESTLLHILMEHFSSGIVWHLGYM